MGYIHNKYTDELILVLSMPCPRIIAISANASMESPTLGQQRKGNDKKGPLFCFRRWRVLTAINFRSKFPDKVDSLSCDDVEAADRDLRCSARIKT